MITYEEMITWLNEHKARFQENEVNGLRQIYVYSKEEYDMKNAHPKKYKNLYVPYIRLSWHPEERDDAIYTRWNGDTRYMTEDGVKSIIVNGI